MTENRPPSARPPGPPLLTAVLVALVAAAGVVYYRAQARAALAQVEHELDAIARLKVEQIGAWRRDQIEDAATFQANQRLRGAAASLLSSPSARGLAALREDLAELAREHDLAEVLLVDAGGRVRISTGGADAGWDGWEGPLREALTAGAPVLVDLRTSERRPRPHLALLIPIAANGAGRTPVGAFVLVIDAAAQLFPLVQSWPSSSESAEALLVRKEGDDVLFLNDLRHVSEAGMRLRIPLSRVGQTEVQAGLGHEGVFQGHDYRGVRVLSVVRRVPGSDWYLVAKVDAAEVLGDWRERSRLIRALVVLAAALAVALAVGVRQRRARKLVQGELRLERERRAALEQRRAQRMLEDALNEIFVFDAQTLRFVDANRAARENLGYTMEELRALTPADLKAPMSREELEALLAPLRTGERAQVEFTATHRRKDGTSYPVEVHVEYHPGDTPLFVAYVYDATERTAAEAALRESEATFRRLFEEHAAVMLLIDGETGQIVDANRAAAAFYGWPRDRLVEMNIGQINTLPPALLAEELRRARAEGRVFFQFRHRRADGSIRDVEVFTTRIDLRGRPTLHSIIMDVTERRRTEAELLRLRAAVEQVGEAILLTDPAGTIVYVNPAFERVTGWTRGEAEGKTPRILRSGQQDGAFYARLWGTILGGGTFKARMVNRRRDGTLFTEESTISPVRDGEGRIVNFVAVKRDITETLALEAELQQAQRLESIGRLAGGVAHDFNNVLGVVQGYADLALRRLRPGEPLREDIEEIRGAARRATEITRQLLAFARKQTIRPVILELNQAIEGSLRMLRRLVGEDVEVAFRAAAGLWPVRMDPTQVDQILANLCVNARDAIADTGRIEIRTWNAHLDDAHAPRPGGLPPGPYVGLSVADDGAGMNPEVLAHIFEPFFTTKEPGKGTGLGLATVYGIVKQNGGHIGVRSAPGEGTTFEILFPRSEALPEDAVPREAPLPRGRGERVLLVEDEPSLLQVGRRILEDLGYGVLAAGSPAEALRIGEEGAGPIDLLMTDVVMPQMNGRELAEALRRLRPGLRCLYMSGYTGDVIATRGVLDEGVEFIQKPFSINELAARVREALDRG